MAELIHYLHQQKEDNLSVVNHYGYEQAEKVCRFHSSFPEYTVTPLVRLENLAKLSVLRIFMLRMKAIALA